MIKKITSKKRQNTNNSPCREVSNQALISFFTFSENVCDHAFSYNLRALRSWLSRFFVVVPRSWELSSLSTGDLRRGVFSEQNKIHFQKSACYNFKNQHVLALNIVNILGQTFEKLFLKIDPTIWDRHTKYRGLWERDGCMRPEIACVTQFLKRQCSRFTTWSHNINDLWKMVAKEYEKRYEDASSSNAHGGCHECYKEACEHLDPVPPGHRPNVFVFANVVG